MSRQKPFKKVVNEQFPIKKKQGGGLIKIEAWENSRGNIAKYSIAYINHLIFAGDNGRVFGYDNSHDYHHRHYFGEIFPVEDFLVPRLLLGNRKGGTNFQSGVLRRYRKQI